MAQDCAHWCMNCEREALKKEKLRMKLIPLFDRVIIQTITTEPSTKVRE